jgi:1-acyl-sn-glycerol-3-phosphate acyltransferase
MSTASVPREHVWLPRATCVAGCVRVDPVGGWGRATRALRGMVRTVLVVALLAGIPLLAIPQPGHARAVRLYFRLVLRCMGVRITQSGGPIRNLPGVLVVSPHISWIDALVINALMSADVVVKAELTRWRGLNRVARAMNMIPIERSKLRRLPDVVHTVAARLRSGQNVVAFPEATTWCGLAYGSFRPAIFQAAVDAGRPVQPLRLSYHHRDGRPSTIPAFVADDTLARSFRRLVTAPGTLANVHVETLQLAGEHRRELARRCQEAVRGNAETGREHVLVA